MKDSQRKAMFARFHGGDAWGVKTKNIIIFSVLFVMFTMTSVVATDVTDCGTFVSGGNYILTQDISSVNRCINIRTNNFVFDCNGYTVTFDSDGLTDPEDLGEAFYAGGGGYNNITIKNCYITAGENNASSAAIQMENSKNITIQNNTINVSASSAISVGFMASSVTNLLLEGNEWYIDLNGYETYSITTDYVNNLTIRDNTFTLTEPALEPEIGYGLIGILDTTGLGTPVLIERNKWYLYNAKWGEIYSVPNQLIIRNEYLFLNSTSMSLSDAGYQIVENNYLTDDSLTILSNITMDVINSYDNQFSHSILIETPHSANNQYSISDFQVNLECVGVTCAGFAIEVGYGDNQSLQMNNVHTTGKATGAFLAVHHLNIDDSNFICADGSKNRFEITSADDFKLVNTDISGTLILRTGTAIAFNDKILLNTTIGKYVYSVVAHPNYIIQEQQWSRVYAESNLMTPVSGVAVTADDVFATEQWTDTTDIDGYTEWHPTPIRTFNETTDPIITYNTYDFYGIKGTETGNELDQTVTQDYIVTIQLSETSPEPSPITGYGILGGVGTCDESNWTPFLIFGILSMVFFAIAVQIFNGAKGVAKVMPILLLVFGVTMILIWLVGC